MATRVIVIKNLDPDNERTWGSKIYQPLEEYTVLENDQEILKTDAILYDDIVTIAQISDGDRIYNDKVSAWNYILGNYVQEVIPMKPDGSSSTLVSHNFCDKTTWFGDSLRITGETLTTSDDLTFSSLYTHWIDLVSGKITYEDRFSSPYRAKIYVNDVLTTTGFTIDYAAGTVTFDSTQTGNTITADYSYATESGWYIRPSTGKVLKLLGTTVKMTTDCQYVPASGHLYFQPFYTYNGVNYPAGSATIYKNMCDLIKCASSCEPVPQFDGIPKGYINLKYDYTTIKELRDSQKTFIKIWLSGHEPMTGTMGAVIGSILSDDEG